MVNIDTIYSVLIKGLNSINPGYVFQRANQENEIPPYPYIIINATSPYIRDKDTIRGTITQEDIADDTKIKINRNEEPKMIFSFSCYSDDESQCITVLKDAVDYLTFIGLQYLNDCGIVILECSTIVNKASWLEVKYQYQWGFDLTIRVLDIISMQVDTIRSVETTNEN